MNVNANTDATLCRRFNVGDFTPVRDLSLAIGRLREAGEMLLAYPASQRRWMFVDTPAGELTGKDVERLQARGWQ